MIVNIGHIKERKTMKNIGRIKEANIGDIKQRETIESIGDMKNKSQKKTLKNFGDIEQEKLIENIGDTHTKMAAIFQKILDIGIIVIIHMKQEEMMFHIKDMKQ